MKAKIGSALIIIGVAVGLWGWFVLGIIGGISAVIDGIKANPTNEILIAFGLIRFWGSALIGLIMGAAFVVPGLALLDE